MAGWVFHEDVTWEGHGLETLCSALCWESLGLLLVGMCLSCHMGQKGRAAAGKELLLSRVVKELSVWPGHPTVWLRVFTEL